MLRKTQYLINSSDRVRGVSSSDFVVKPQPPIRNVVNTQVRMAVIEGGLINVDETNNTFLWNTDIVSLPIGYYDQQTLASAVADLITSYSSSTTSIYVDILASQKLRIRSTTAYTISFVGYAATATLLGFAAIAYPVSSSTSGFFQITAPNPVSIKTYDYIFLQSSKLGERVKTSRGFSAYAMLLNYTSANTSSLLYENYLNKDNVNDEPPKDLEEIDLRLVDEDGKVVNLRNQELAVLLEVFTKD